MNALVTILHEIPAMVSQNSLPSENSRSVWLIVGIIISLGLLVYLLKALFHPEKF